MRAFRMAGRVIRQIVKDRRTLALLFIAPLLVIFLLYTVFHGQAAQPKVQALSLPAEFLQALEQEAAVTSSDDLAQALALLKDRQIDAVVCYNEPEVTVYVEGSESAVTQSVKKALAAGVGSYAKTYAQQQAQEQKHAQEQKIKRQIQSQLQKQMQQVAELLGPAAPPLSFSLRLPQTEDLSLTLPEVSYTYLNGSEDMTAFDSIAPLMMGFFVFFFVFLLAGVAFLRERISGTLERLLATPARRYEIVLGYFLGFGLFVFLQTLLVQVYMVHVLHIALKGSFLLVLLTNLMLAAGSLALGTLLSAFARNELQLFQFIPLVIVPQVLFCGLFSLRNAPVWVTALSKIFPLTYAADALTNVATRGFGWSAIWPDLLMLFGYMAVFLLLNTLVLKKYRRI